MTNHEAKFILQAYRHTGADASDPVFAEALEQARRDPELARWFAEEREFDAAISEKLREVPVPEGLRTDILAGSKVVRPARWRVAQPVWLPAAAVLVLLLAVAALWLRPDRSGQLAGFRSEVIALAEESRQHLDLKASDVAQLQQWLAQHQAVGDFRLPAGLRDLPAMGCRVLEWRRHKVSLLCFMRQGADHVHLFVIDRKDLPGAPTQAAPQFASTGRWATASWTYGDRTYVLAALGDEAALKKYL